MKRMKLSQSGQSIVLFALGLVALLAMAALLVDGGQTYMHRRQAQAAADAGALAGARELCVGDAAGARAMAINYAVNQNGATTAEATIEGDELVVTAHIAQKSFFAQLIGRSAIDVQAQAASGCYSPGSASALPVAWSCKPPSLGQTSDSGECVIQQVDYQTEIVPHLTQAGYFYNHVLHDLYIVMDAKKVEDDVSLSCAPYGPLDCDIDNDGINEFVGGGGGRSWLDLDGGGGGVPDLESIMCQTKTVTVSIHQWLPDETGNKASLYKKVKDCIENKVVLMPVFNAYCDGDPRNGGNASCLADAHDDFPAGIDDFSLVDNGKYNYHIVGFVPFFVTCVHGQNSDNCIGHDSVVDTSGKAYLSKTDNSIEGYFITNYPFDLGEGTPGGVDLGVYVRTLRR